MNEIDQKYEQSSSFINKYSYDQLLHWGVDERWASLINTLILFIVATIAVVLIHWVVRWIFRLLLRIFHSKIQGTFFGYLKQNRVPHYLALIAPVVFIRNVIPVVFENYPTWISPMQTLLGVYIIFMVIWIIFSFFKSGANMLEVDERFSQRPIRSYLQVVKIILYLFGAVALFSMLTGNSPLKFFGVMGAASAVLLLMFKDTIMGFVASIQVTTNDMVRIGDWIEMPKYGADGDIVAMSLTTVKVQNWDKTITMLPTHTLISDSFKNWRGMQEFGGRRIKRSIIIKQSTIRYLEDKELPKFKKINAISDYIDERKKEIDTHNQKLNLDRSLLVNGRNFTNFGLFRQYASWYVQNHPGVHKGKTIMVRQLAPTEHGMPLELYLFTNDVRWVYYEAILADIFDHLIAAVPYFDLHIYEEISDSNDSGAYKRKAISSEDSE